MLVQEPLQAAIWHCLNHYDYSDATFLAERLFAEVHSEESLHLLATCYYRAGKLNEAYDILKEEGLKTSQNKFLLAKCCADLNKLPEAESVLNGDFMDPRRDLSVDDMVGEFGESAAFAFQLLGTIYGRTERTHKAIECEKRALKLNPFLWKAFESLCNRGEFLDPNSVFTVTNLENFNYCHGVNPILTLVNSSSSPCHAAPCVTVTSTANLLPVTPLMHAMVTPVNAETPLENSLPMELALNESTPFASVTPVNNSSVNTPRMMSGIGTLNFSADSTADMPLTAQRVNFLVPPPLRRKAARNGAMQSPSSPAPAKNLSYSKCLDDSFGTPTFGMLPRSTAARSDLGSIALKLDFTSPSLSVLSPMSFGQNDSPIPNCDKVPLVMKQKRTVMASKENPLKPNVFGQSGNNGNQNITPSPVNQIVRRSSRLFGSTQSVKENSKAPTKKPRAQNSPSRKSKGRLALTTQTELAEKNEKNKAEREKLEKEPIGEDLFKKPVYVNLGAQALVIQKQSVDGLMHLMRQLAAGYVELSRYNCRKAIQTFEALPINHGKTGWILGLLGKAYFELAEYKEAKMYFKALRDKDPYRVEFMEYYSTALWHLQDDVELSALAQELTRVNKNSPQAWCAAGNCFSHLKEHENAIKFFKRAGQVDPSFAYSYTLLGHEYVMIEELDQALACFRSAVRMDPRHYNAWYGIGLTYYKQERYQLADIYYRKALGINPLNPILMCHIAVVQHAMQKTEKALETLNIAIKNAPKNSLCKFERASILFAAERYYEALEELNELKDLVPKESPVYFLLGKVHNKLNNTHLALMHFSWAMDLDPKGANSQIKDALDPTLNRATQEENVGTNAPHEEMMQTGTEDFQNMSESFNPEGGASTSQESLDATESPSSSSRFHSHPASRYQRVVVTPPPSSSRVPPFHDPHTMADLEDVVVTPPPTRDDLTRTSDDSL